MPRIARHHLDPNDPFGGSFGHTPRQDWPEDTYVQWGGHGVVLADEPYHTAFFEAFPAAGGFIRGEGATITEAEAAAFMTWQKEAGCRHRFGRRGYRNGAGLCTICNAFMTNIFPPITELGGWRKPPSGLELDTISKGWLRATETTSDAKSLTHSRKLYLRARLAGIDLPPTPAGIMTTREFLCLDDDPYRAACSAAVSVWLAREPHIAPQGPRSPLEALLGAISAHPPEN